ncbi:helix-turn-helix domain-containing protein [Aquimarina agarilytica]|uniref:helix-turn-helix domain-containing protein n=1 Tax=Aquimarina agarilytica TaxID=1087449 RepID=UPI0002896347|nr:helix-turn-helix transcriptional regulator [Aquimarina agarilytica]
MSDKEELQISIGKRIRVLREQKGITQQQVADACNFEKSNMSRLEAGGTNPTLYTLKKIADFLELTLNDLVSF